jgi:hypothetical protein
MAAQSRGAFSDMNTPPQKRKLRSLAIVGLIGTFGTFGSLGLLFLNLAGVIVLHPGVILIPFGIFGLMLAIAGILKQREIDRRL